MLAPPETHCLAFPPMKPYKTSFAERMFLADVRTKLTEAFAADSDQDRKFTDLLRERGDEAKELVIKLMRDIRPHGLIGSREKEYTVGEFASEKHDR